MHNSKLCCLLSFLFIVFNFATNAQNQEIKTYKVSLVQKYDTICVPYATIINMQTQEVFESDDHGVILIKGAIGDTIKFHCLGFE